MLRYLLILFVAICRVYSEEAVLRFDGILGTVTDKISNLTINAAFFMPYNPTILEIGGYKGQNTVALANAYPKGRIISFEPNPKAFNQLLATVQNCKNVSAYNLALNTYNGYAKLNINHGIYCNDESLEGLSSLLNEDPRYPYFRGPQIDVPCVILDDWCLQNGIERVHFIQLDCEGYELQILKSSPWILQDVLVICTKTHFFPFRQGTSQYAELEAYLDSCGFKMLSHWYREGLQGEATFIRKYIYSALFD